MKDSRGIPALLSALIVALVLHALLLPWGAAVLASPSGVVAEGFKPDSESATPATSTADLIVGRVWTPQRLIVGTPFSLRFEVLNRGAASASVIAPAPWWSDAVWLSDDRALSDDDLSLVQVDALRRLGAGESYEAKRDVEVPAEWWANMPPVREWFLLFVADANQNVEEGDREHNNIKAVPVELRESASDPVTPHLGRDDAPTRLTVAWISHEAFEALQAPESRTIQPAVQSAVDPTPDAPLRPADAEALPTPPVAPSPPSADPTAEADEATEANEAAEAALPPELMEAATAWLEKAAQGLAMLPSPTDAEDPGEGDAATPPEPPDAPAPTETTNDDTDADGTDAAPPETSPSVAAVPETDDPRPVQPTSAPRGDADADPADLVSVNVLEAGAVEVSEGLEVVPSRPDIAVTALLTTIPRNPVVKITFDTDGTVLDAGFVTPTGSVMFDSPIRNSLFRWRARGEQLGKWSEPHTYRFEIELRKP